MYKAYLKRIVDIVLGLLLLLLVSWFILLIGVIYWVNNQGPVFFFQSRIGKDEVLFDLIKFRTLKENVELPLGERRFFIGKILRYTSLDELPQLINILKGEMSLIGPRPLPVKYLSRFSSEQRKRHAVKPGLTGWAQVNGRNSISWDEKFRYDLEYVERCSLLFDFWIMIKTALILLSFRKDVSLHEEEFKGKS